MNDFKIGQAVEWRNSGRWITAGTVRSVEPDGWVHINSELGDWFVRDRCLHPPGELAAEDAELADLIGRAKSYPLGDDEHAQRARRNGFPWCDTCKRPSVWSEFFGAMHTTAEHPYGVPHHLDESGHEVTHQEWYRVPTDRKYG